MINIKEKLKEYFAAQNPRKKAMIIKVTVAVVVMILLVVFFRGREKEAVQSAKNEKQAAEIDLAFDKTHLEEAWFAKASKKEQEYEKRLKDIETHLRIIPDELDEKKADFKKEYRASMQRLATEKENILNELERIKKQENEGDIDPVDAEEKIKTLLKERDEIIRRDEAMRKEQEEKERKPVKEPDKMEIKTAYPPTAQITPPEKMGAAPLPIPPGGLIKQPGIAEARQQHEAERPDPKARPGEATKPGHANLIHMEMDSAKTIAGNPGQPDNRKKDGPKVIPIESVIPVGSFFRVTLLSGIDAATGMKAQSQPQPVLLKINNISQLPNKFRQDVQQCHIIGEAFGSLSDERAYIRTSTLSCIKKDNGLINSKIEGWITGEDGTLGLRGKVVSKKGAFLARRIVASFLEGVSAAFSNSGKRVDNYLGGTTTTIQPSDAFQVGVGQGASDAMKDLAESYKKMSEDITVVIEIASGRKGHVVVSTETPLDVKKKLAS